MQSRRVQFRFVDTTITNKMEVLLLTIVSRRVFVFINFWPISFRSFLANQLGETYLYMSPWPFLRFSSHYLNNYMDVCYVVCSYMYQKLTWFLSETWFGMVQYVGRWCPKILFYFDIHICILIQAFLLNTI